MYWGVDLMGGAGRVFGQGLASVAERGAEPLLSNDCFFACQAFELDAWPIPHAAVILSETINGIQFSVISLPDGSLGLRIVRSGANEDYETDIIVPERTFKVVLSINYSPLKPSIRINGTDVESAPVGTRTKNIFPLRAQPAADVEELPIPSQHVPEEVSGAEALFIRTVGDLSCASRSQDWYTLLKSSAPLRLLLLDELLHKANEHHKVRIQFRVAAPGQPPPVEFDRLWHAISPQGLPAQNVAYVSLDQFLKLRVFESRTEAITVKDVIRAAANADGGVSFEDSKQPQEALMLELDKGSMRMGHAASRHLLKEICAVVVESTIPLLAKIQG